MVALEPGFHNVPEGFFDQEIGPVGEVVEGSRRWAVLQGDAVALLADVAPGTFDAVVADPPYSSGGAFRVDKARDTAGKYQQGSARLRYPDFSGDSRDQRSYLAWSSLWLAAAHRATRPAGVCMVFSDWRQLPTMTDALQAGGWVWRGVVPWDKRRARPSMGSFTNQCEYVVWGTSGTVDRKTAPLPGFYSIHVDPREKQHMAGKPIALMRALLRILPADSLVLDPFAGSGSTGLAAIHEGHRFVGVELDQHYAEVARQRLAHV
jgi:site-specific DNA-methyltransferase (adenine-specific)